MKLPIPTELPILRRRSNSTGFDERFFVENVLNQVDHSYQQLELLRVLQNASAIQKYAALQEYGICFQNGGLFRHWNEEFF